jgi:hypothetical protein
VTGSQSISIPINNNEKDSFRVVAAIQAAPTKLPSRLTATRKTTYIEESHFGILAAAILTTLNQGSAHWIPLPAG